MKIKTPIWNLKILCPCCGQSSLVFVACPSCGQLTVHCDETDETFKDMHHLNKGFTENCTTCKTKTTDFLTASTDQVLKAGFTEDDYE